MICFLLGGGFGLILGCCLASASKEDKYRELEYENEVLRRELYRGRKWVKKNYQDIIKLDKK